jgi:fumarate hydratase subunit beta
VTYAGCGALLSKFVREAKPVLYPELGPEAVFKLKVKDFPVIVAIDFLGNDIYNKQHLNK